VIGPANTLLNPAEAPVTSGLSRQAGGGWDLGEFTAFGECRGDGMKGAEKRSWVWSDCQLGYGCGEAQRRLVVGRSPSPRVACNIPGMQDHELYRRIVGIEAPEQRVASVTWIASQAECCFSYDGLVPSARYQM
jgi:hypothetical protein